MVIILLLDPIQLLIQLSKLLQRKKRQAVN